MQASKPVSPGGYSPAYAWFVVAILMMAYVFSFVDRQILNLMVGPIRADLGITDTQMSLLMGFSFAIFTPSWASRWAAWPIPRADAG